MKEKLSALLTLGCIFSLFFYYKIINPVESDMINSNINNDSKMQFEKTIIDEDIFLVNDMVAENIGNIEDDCNLDLDKTNKMDFSSAFKYFRNCNGSNSTFSWNNNVYSTILLSEIKSHDNELNQLNDDNSLVVDKKHLSLQNHIIGDNSNIE